MIKRHNIPPHTQDWFAWRKKGYGASEVATCMSEYNDALSAFIYSSPKALHLDKISEPIQKFNGNPNSEAGHMMEPFIIDMYRYWDNDNPDIMLMHKRRKAKRRMNKVRSAKFFMANSKYDWLFFSPDAIEYKKTFLEDGTIKWIAVGIIECKNTTSMEVNRYPDKVSPSFIAQVCQGLLISELDYARVLVFIDGWKLEVITIYNDSTVVTEIQQNILECTYRSWQRVLHCREVKEQYGVDKYYSYNVDSMTQAQQEGVAQLQALEPEVSGSETEWQWIKDNVHKTEEFSTMEVSQEQCDQLRRRLSLKDKEKQVKKLIRVVDSKLVESLGEYHQANIDNQESQPLTAFSYKPDRNGSNSIYVNPKIYERL